MYVTSQVLSTGVDIKPCTCGILKGMCGLWKPTAKKKGSPSLVRLFSNWTASSVLSRSGRVPPGCSVTFTAHSKLTWSLPSSPLHIWKQGFYANHLKSRLCTVAAKIYISGFLLAGLVKWCHMKAHIKLTQLFLFRDENYKIIWGLLPEIFQ